MPNTYENIAENTAVIVKISGVETPGIFKSWNRSYDGYANVEVNGRTHIRKIQRLASEGANPMVVRTEVAAAVINDDDEPVTNTRFTINQRFDFLSRMVKMVATSTPSSLIVTGQGGLGKSFTVKQTLTQCGLEEGVDYVIIKGFSTPRSLFTTLWENRDRIVVFDDCDEVLKNNVATNILKGALDSNDVRTISWLTARGGATDEDGNGCPNQFDFQGKVIFISNMSLHSINQAILSRALYVDVAMTTDEKIERMGAIAAHVRPNLTIEQKREVLDFLSHFKAQIKDLNMRTFLKVCDVRVAEPADWREIGEYIVTA